MDGHWFWVWVGRDGNIVSYCSVTIVIYKKLWGLIFLRVRCSLYGHCRFAALAKKEKK